MNSILSYESRGRKIIAREFDDLVARVIQHDPDQLDVLTMVDRISPLKRSFLRSKLKRLATAAAEGKFAKDIE